VRLDLFLYMTYSFTYQRKKEVNTGEKTSSSNEFWVGLHWACKEWLSGIRTLLNLVHHRFMKNTLIIAYRNFSKRISIQNLGFEKEKEVGES